MGCALSALRSVLRPPVSGLGFQLSAFQRLSSFSSSALPVPGSRFKVRCSLFDVRCLVPFLLSAFCFSLLLWPCGLEAVDARKIDLTAGTNRFSVDRTWTYNLGATGMRGWIDNGWPETPAQDGYTAFAPFQILVTHIATNTPASGIMAVDDLILGASAGPGAVPLFTNDARKSLGWAIVDAEAGTGVLSLKRWRAGTTTDVSITLPIMGAYSATALMDPGPSTPHP